MRFSAALDVLSKCGRWGLFALAGVVLCSITAAAEPPAPPSLPAAQQAPRADSPGFLDALNRWFDESASNFKSGMKGTRDTLTDIGNSAKNATDALTKSRIVTGRELCQNAPNGSPDCRTAAEMVCRGKGYTSGKSLDTESAQKCPARLWLSGRLPADGECAVETHLVRAVCQ